MARITSCEFVGSFFKTDQLPRDRKVQIALAGRSNVGKSSLLNRLVGRKRMAKVSAAPGKTRSLNFFLINESFYLVDLPGYGYAKVSRSIRQSWGKMIENYMDQATHLIGLFLLMDCRREATEEDMQLVEWLTERKIPVLIVVTKADKLNRDKINRKIQAVEREFGLGAIPFSAVSGIGKNELVDSALQLVAENNKTLKA